MDNKWLMIVGGQRLPSANYHPHRGVLSMLAKLLEQGAAAESRREIAVTKEEFLIGRGSDCDLRLGGSPISRHHCLLHVRGSEATLADLGSANGTFVNGRRIRSQTALFHGDEIGLGDYRFLLEMAGVSGIDWGTTPGLTPEMPTLRVPPRKAEGLEKAPKKEESHPPGEAGG